MRWVFRFLARDGWLVEEQPFMQALQEAGEEVPQERFEAVFHCFSL